MDKRNEPMRLEDQAREKVNRMLHYVCQDWVNELHLAAANGRHSFLRKIALIRNQSRQLRLVLSDIPVPLVGELVITAAIKCFCSLISTYNERRLPSLYNAQEKRLHYRVCKIMMKAVMLPCVSRYDIMNEGSKFVQELLFGLMYVVPNIKFLQLSVRTNMDFMVNSVPFLKDLREFHCQSQCSNEIIFKLVQYCPNLNTLDAQSSKFVTDCCLTALLKCKHLVRINLADTYVTAEGYASLLSTLQIIDLTWFGPIDRVLVHVTELPSVRFFVGSFSNPKTLIEKCPNLTHLTLLSVPVNVSKLQELPGVQALVVFLTSYISTNLGTLFKSLGSTLVTLALHQVVFVDVDAIANYCVSLKKMEFNYSHFTRSTDRPFNSQSKHFTSVTDLTAKHNWGDFDYSSILHLYVNLEHFFANDIPQINDDSIENVIARGGLSKLRTFTVEGCGEMGIRTVWNLVHHARNLTGIGNISSWAFLSNENVMQIRNFIRVHNLTLKIFR